LDGINVGLRDTDGAAVLPALEGAKEEEGLFVFAPVAAYATSSSG